MADASVDVVVIGAGVTGLASALHIARAGRSVCVVERHRRSGMETSTHNSAVIHAGLYYPAGSLKARLCVEGAHRLYEFCRTHGVPHDRCGKFVVATDGTQVAGLEALRNLGTTNGAEGLEVVDQAFVTEREPNVRAHAALWSPNSGRIQPESLVRALQQLSEAQGALMLQGVRFEDGGARGGGGFELRIGSERIETRAVVNAAGLYADEVSRALGGEAFTIHPCRGEYAQLKPSRRDWVNGLVYPLPDHSGHSLGTHLTKTVEGALLVGPTARYQERKDDYEENRLPLESFVEPARVLLPRTTLDDLTYAGSGIRPKLQGPHEQFADFKIAIDAKVPGLVQAAGIESPGLTACLSVGESVARLVQEVLA